MSLLIEQSEIERRHPLQVVSLGSYGDLLGDEADDIEWDSSASAYERIFDRVVSFLRNHQEDIVEGKSIISASEHAV
jgi:hypothetical protein